MKILLTGAFGTIGRSAIEALAGHDVRCFDLKTPAAESAAAALRGRIEVVWGDLRDAGAVAAAVRGVDAVLHLGAVIPPVSERRPDLARAVNVGGTAHVLAAARAEARPPAIVFASSVSIFGTPAGRSPPRTAADPIRPTDHYSRHKAEGEALVRAAGLPWTILRFGVVQPVRMGPLDPVLFDIPLETRMEFLHPADAGRAVASAAGCEAARGKVLLVGGGPSCRIRYRELVEKLLRAAGLRSHPVRRSRTGAPAMLPDSAFSRTPYYTDWIDSEESERLLRYQTRSFDDFVREAGALLGPRRFFVRLVGPIARAALLRRSPYAGAAAARI